MEDETINEAMASSAISMTVQGHGRVMRHFGRRFGDIDVSCVRIKSHVFKRTYCLQNIDIQHIFKQ